MTPFMSADAESELQGILVHLHAQSAADTRGQVASYIPELSLAAPSRVC